MKIAFVSTIAGWPWGGADALWTRAAEGALDRGDRVLLALFPKTLAHPRISALRARGATVFERPAHVPQGMLSRVVNRLGRRPPPSDPLPAALQEFAPDLVVISCGGTYDLVAEPALCAWLARGAPYRVLANLQHEHPELPEDQRLRARDILSSARQAWFLSRRNLETTRRHLAHPLPNADTVQIPLRWTSADRSPWPASPPWRMATVSRLSPEKGLPLLLHAVATVLGAEADWRLTLYGQGPQESRLRELVAYLGLSDRVTFAGFAESLREIWANNHLMVSPAHEEGVPMTIPEAMLCGRPVLATAIGGAEEWIRPDNGFICPAPSRGPLEDTLARAWDARPSWAAMGERAARDAEQRLAPDDWRRIIAVNPATSAPVSGQPSRPVSSDR